MANKIKLTVSVPHIQKEYDVELPDNTTGKRLFEALTKKLGASGGGSNDVFELFSKKAQVKVYPDLQDQSLKQMGIQPGDTVILKKDMDPGAISQ